MFFVCFMLFVGHLCTATPCVNAGTCLETGDTRTCDCVAGYTGQDCETGRKWIGLFWYRAASGVIVFKAA